jgi:nucleoside-diphosphate-sugar epimerase
MACGFHVGGTRQVLSNPDTGVAAIFASKLMNGQSPLVFADGKQMRDFVSVYDIVHANHLAMQRKESDGEVIDIGCGKPISILHGAEIPAARWGRRERVRADGVSNCAAASMREDDGLCRRWLAGSGFLRGAVTIHWR